MTEYKNQANNKLIAAIIIFAAIVPCILMTAPAVASQLSLQLKLTEAKIGYLFMAELGAMSLATIPAYWWITRCNWKRVARVAIVVFCLSNLTSAFVEHYYLLIFCRFIAASGGGALMILCMSSASYTPHPSRIYGLWVLGQLVVGALGLLILPYLFYFFGLKIIYLTLAFIILITLPLVSAFPECITPPRHTLQNTNKKVPFFTISISIIGVLFFYIGLSGIWTFIGHIAEKIVLLTPETTGRILSIATVLGIVGASLASIMSGRLKAFTALWIGYSAMIISILLLIETPLIIRFIAAAFIFKFTWTFVLPFILGTVATLDTSGKLMNTVNLVMGGGMAIGPAVAGILIQYGGGVNILIIFSSIIVFVSMLLILWIKLKQNNNKMGLEN